MYTQIYVYTLIRCLITNERIFSVVDGMNELVYAEYNRLDKVVFMFITSGNFSVLGEIIKTSCAINFCWKNFINLMFIVSHILKISLSCFSCGMELTKPRLLYCKYCPLEILKNIFVQ